VDKRRAPNGRPGRPDWTAPPGKAVNADLLASVVLASRPAIMGQVLGIVYRVIAGHLIKKAGFTARRRAPARCR
jgi:hypothetical protein